MFDVFYVDFLKDFRQNSSISTGIDYRVKLNCRVPEEDLLRLYYVVPIIAMLFFYYFIPLPIYVF